MTPRGDGGDSVQGERSPAGLDAQETGGTRGVVSVTGVVEASGASSETDPWIPLSVKWDVLRADGPLYLLLKDPVDGFVELKIDPESGALVGFVVIDLPRADEWRRSPGELPLRAGTAAVAREMWRWKVTPDYREPAERHREMTCPLRTSLSEQRLTVWFGDGVPAAYLASGEVLVTVSEACSLLAITAPWPQEAAELWPLSDAKAQARADESADQLTVSRSTGRAEVFVQGSRARFSALLDWLADPVGVFACGGVALEGAPAVTAFVWQSRDTGPLLVRLHDGTLRFEGTEEARSWLAEDVAFLLADGREGVGLRIEHYPGHPVLSERSVPLVLAIEAGAVDSAP